MCALSFVELTNKEKPKKEKKKVILNKQSTHVSRITEMHLKIYDTVMEACYSVFLNTE